MWSKPWNSSATGDTVRSIKVTGEATIETTPDELVFYPYFDYNESYFNNFVPILKLKDYQLVPANFNTIVNKEESTDEQSKE